VKKKSTPKQKKNNILRYFFFGIIFFYLLIRFIPIVTTSSNDTSIAEYGSIKVVNELDCYIVRSEKTVNSVMEGSIKYLVPQGEKVEKGYNVVEISRDIVDDSTREKLEVINQRIESLNTNENVLFQSDVEKLDIEVAEIINSIKDYNEKKDLIKVEALRIELKNKLQKKRIISGDKSFAGKNMSELQLEQEQLEHKVNNSMGWVSSPGSGIVSYYFDGYENVLNPKNIEVLELDKLNSIDKQPIDLRTDKVINNQPLFKIVDNQLWNIIAWVNHENSEDYEKGKSVVFKFPHGEVKAEIYNKIENETADLLIFKTNEYTEDFLLQRNLKVDVTVVNYEGLKIFSDSIIEKEGKKGVYLLDINRNAVFKPIQIIGFNEEYAIVKSNVFYEKKDGETRTIETIKLYDEVVRKAEKVKEGQLVF